MGSYCYNCMYPIASEIINCPHCGKPQFIDALPHQLEPGTLLRDRYLIGRTLGQGGFGITYIGRDMLLDIRVAIKEFYPNGYAYRDHDVTRMVTVTDNGASLFRDGKQKFLREAQILARFNAEPGIVSVHDYFEENNTAYIVMEYLNGITLKSFVASRGGIPADVLFSMMKPLIKALGKVHEQGIIHRDISPDNIIVMSDKPLKLLDFGSAREVGEGKSLSVMLKPGYAPEEQYRSRGKQGPWTDVYSLCATMYYSLTGVKPEESVERAMNPDSGLQPPSTLGAIITPAQENVILHGMAIRNNERYQSMRELEAAIDKACTKDEEKNIIAITEEITVSEIASDGNKTSRIGKTPPVVQEPVISHQEEAVTTTGRLSQKQRATSASNTKQAESYKEADDIQKPKSRKLGKLIAMLALCMTLSIGGVIYLRSRGDAPVHVVDKASVTPAPMAISSPEVKLEPTQEPALTPIQTPIPTPNGKPISEGKTEEGLSYEVFADCVRISNCLENAKSIIVPAQIDGKPVTDIGEHAFHGCKYLESITIPNSVTRIGERAFFYCTSMTNITIPDSVISIGNSAFLGCSSLTSITIPDSVTSIGDDAFRQCDSLASITIPDSVTAIGGSSFYSCSSLTSITIPDSVTTIGEGVFSHCDSLKSITLPNSLTNIGDEAFYACKSLTSITLPNGVTSIGNHSFDHCESLTNITMPNSVTSIGKLAFYCCYALTSVTLPSSVTSIGDDAFMYCISLTSINIPNGVTNLDGNPAPFCYKLSRFVVDNGHPNYYSKDGVLYTKDMQTLVACPYKKGHFTIPDNVTNIGNNAFHGCNRLTGITIPNSVTSIGNSAFLGCHVLADITISNNVTHIGDSAFRACDALTSIVIPHSVTSIGGEALFNCESLTDVYYGGTQQEWERISKGESVTSAVIHYNYQAD